MTLDDDYIRQTQMAMQVLCGGLDLLLRHPEMSISAIGVGLNAAVSQAYVNVHPNDRDAWLKAFRDVLEQMPAAVAIDEAARGKPLTRNN